MLIYTRMLSLPLANELVYIAVGKAWSRSSSVLGILPRFSWLVDSYNRTAARK